MKYTAIGKMRGVCTHNHRTISGVFGCIVIDQNLCARVGEHSDRVIMRTDGKDLTISERHELEALQKRQYREKRGW
jgi:class 3 adenylate cyclase